MVELVFPTDVTAWQPSGSADCALLKYCKAVMSALLSSNLSASTYSLLQYVLTSCAFRSLYFSRPSCSCWGSSDSCISVFIVNIDVVFCCLVLSVRPLDGLDMLLVF